MIQPSFNTIDTLSIRRGRWIITGIFFYPGNRLVLMMRLLSYEDFLKTIRKYYQFAHEVDSDYNDMFKSTRHSFSKTLHRRRTKKKITTTLI
jgi:NAD-dependent SIR2 family protein deacetylase